MKEYDVVFVGAGLTNATIAYKLSEQVEGLNMLVIDRRGHLGGNCYTENVDGIDIHKYGAHIFHTSDPDIAAFVKKFGTWHDYVNQPIAISRDYFGSRHAYNMPFNMNTFAQLFPGCVTPEDARLNIYAEIMAAHIKEPKNLEEQAISMVGTTIYETLVKGYTEKQWGRPCTALPPDIIKRLPVRFTYDNNYFNDKYQMIPDTGYTDIIRNMFTQLQNNCHVSISYCDYKELPSLNISGKHVFYSGGIDELYDYKLGILDYRSVRFEEKRFEIPNVQGCAVCNYTSVDVPYTRSIEHKWFAPKVPTKSSIVSYEYSNEWKPGIDPYYPICDAKNNALYGKYVDMHNELNRDAETKVWPVGRLGTYKYLDMDDSIAAAMKVASEWITKYKNV